jgi:hypothetical protein
MLGAGNPRLGRPSPARRTFVRRHWDMEDLIDQVSSEAENILQERPDDRDLKQEFGSRLLASLPIDPCGGNACRKCGLCQIEQGQVPAHLEAPAQCLFDRPSS